MVNGDDEPSHDNVLPKGEALSILETIWMENLQLRKNSLSECFQQLTDDLKSLYAFEEPASGTVGGVEVVEESVKEAIHRFGRKMQAFESTIGERMDRLQERSDVLQSRVAMATQSIARGRGERAYVEGKYTTICMMMIEAKNEIMDLKDKLSKIGMDSQVAATKYEAREKTLLRMISERDNELLKTAAKVQFAENRISEVCTNYLQEAEYVDRIKEKLRQIGSRP